MFKRDSKCLRQSALIQPQGVRGAHVRGPPGWDECRRERAGGEDQCGGGDGRGVGRGDAEQLGLDELTEGCDARERDGHPYSDHRDGVAQDEADGGSSRGAKRQTDADFASAAGDHEGHHAVETDQR